MGGGAIFKMGARNVDLQHVVGHAHAEHGNDRTKYGAIEAILNLEIPARVAAGKVAD